MSVLIASANGNLTDAATWGVVDATSFLDAETGNTALTTSYVESTEFTPGAIEIDGVAVKVATRASSPTGTISVRIAQGGATVAGTEVTIDVSDIESRDGEQGWYFFKFSAPVTLLAATAYTVSAKTSSASQVNLYRNATAANWARMLRTTTTGAPAAGDSFHILGEWTAAATKTNRSVTMNSTAATDYGNGTAISASNPAGVTVGKGGTLTYGTTAATNYVLRVSTSIIVWVGGTLNIGVSSGTAIPRDSTAVLEFDIPSADGDFGLEVFGTLNTAGLSRTSGKNVVQCLLNTDEAAAQTVLGVDTDTGWLNGDEIALASTSRTASQHETATLNGNAAATTITISAGLTNAHSGTSPTQAEVILLSRNVQIRSVSTTLMAYVHIDQAAVVDCAWTLFRYLGSTTIGKRGIDVETTTGSATFSYCALRDFDNHGILLEGTGLNNVTISQLVVYNVGGTTTHAAVDVQDASTGSSCSFSDITVIDSAGYGINFAAVPGPLARLRAASCGSAGLNIATTRLLSQTITNVVCHSGAADGLALTTMYGGRISDVTVWRNNPGSGQGGITVADVSGVVIDGGNVFGNASRNISFTSTASSTGIHFRDLVVAGDTSFATTTGLAFFANSKPIHGVVLENCTFGVVSGIYTAHTDDIDFGSAKFADITLRNTLLASADELENDNLLLGRSAIRYQRVDQATGVHKTVYPALGTVSLDTTVFHNASPSENLTPSGATSGLRLRSSVKRVAVALGEVVTASVYVNKTSAYTGSAPRLLLLSNAALGIDDDVVLATFSAGSDVWQQLSGTTTPASEEDGVVEFVVEVDGSAGSVYIDDWSASAA